MYSTGQRGSVEEQSGGGGSDPLLAPGYRFYPTEEELLTFYLRHRLAGTRPDVQHFIPVVDIYSYHPSQLQAMAGLANVGDSEQWFFFCPRAEREVHGGRPARTTPSGYWKATGSPSYVYSAEANRVIGEKRTMVFYQGRAPTGSKTRWKMNEYKAVATALDGHHHDHEPPPPPPAAGAPIRLQNEFSVCRVYVSTGTLRSFDRRPLNTPGGGGGVALYDQAAAAIVAYSYHHQQQQQVLPLPPPRPPPPAAAVVAPSAANSNGGQQASENNNSDDSSSSAGSRGNVMDEDAATPIDWDSLVAPVDDPSFSVDDNELSRVIWPRN